MHSWQKGHRGNRSFQSGLVIEKRKPSPWSNVGACVTDVCIVSGHETLPFGKEVWATETLDLSNTVRYTSAGTIYEHRFGHNIIADEYFGINRRTTIGAAKQLPIVDAGPPQTVESGTPVTLTATASDPNTGNNITPITWTTPAGVNLMGGDTQTPSFTAPSLNVGDPDQIDLFG